MYIISQVYHKILLVKDHVCLFMFIASSHALQNRDLLMVMTLLEFTYHYYS